MKKNLRFRLLTGQSVVIEDVIEYTVDTLGIHITLQDIAVQKVGDEMKKTVQIKKAWMNIAGVVTFQEEFA